MNTSFLPTFCLSNPEVWFLQCESLFHLRQVEDSVTRFHHVVSVLPASVATAIIDVLRNPGAVDPYKRMRSAVLSHLGKDSPQQVKVEYVDLDDQQDEAEEYHGRREWMVARRT
jgi:hypothetical protein